MQAEHGSDPAALDPFPGQTSYTQGTANILVDVQGGFTWQRRTGKTIDIFIKDDSGTAKSNRLILRVP